MHLSRCTPYDSAHMLLGQHVLCSLFFSQRNKVQPFVTGTQVSSPHETICVTVRHVVVPAREVRGRTWVCPSRGSLLVVRSRQFPAFASRGTHIDQNTVVQQSLDCVQLTVAAVCPRPALVLSRTPLPDGSVDEESVRVFQRRSA